VKEANSTHDLKGLSLIGDLYILMGLEVGIAGIFFLLFLNLIGLVFLGFGFFLAAIGYYLDELEPWAWWGAFLGNLGAGGTIGFTLVGSPLVIAVTLIYIIAQAALTFGICIYLLRPSVRSLFFVSENM